MADDFAEPHKHDTTIPGGCYITGGRANPQDGKHYGGKVTDSEGKVLAEFGDDEVNDGKPRKKDEHKAADDKKPADDKNTPVKPPVK